MVLGVTEAPPAQMNDSPIGDAVARAGILQISVEQYHQMIKQGIVPEDATVELLHGVLVRKDRGGGTGQKDPMGQSPLHILAITLLVDLAARVKTDRWHMKVQAPIACPPDGEPEPDGVILRGTAREYIGRLAGPGDVLCVIEAADSSLSRDRKDKLPIYAEAGVPQYVIINLQNRTAEVYESPDPTGRDYRSRVTLEAGEVLRLRLPEGVFEVGVAELLP